MNDNPYSTEIRYMLDLMGHAAHLAQPRSVRIASTSVEIAKSVVRRMCYEPYTLFVENREIQNAVRRDLGIETQLQRSGPVADVAIFPFSLADNLKPENEPCIVVACQNALSYKSLLYPGSVHHTVFKHMSELSPAYHLKPCAGLYSPCFIFWWALARLVERWHSAWYFRLEDIAMRRIIHFGPLWRFSYLVLFTGQLAG